MLDLKGEKMLDLKGEKMLDLKGEKSLQLTTSGSIIASHQTKGNKCLSIAK